MPQLIKAFRKGKTTFFSEKVWKSGSPQRYGWVGEFEDEPRKKIPAEILEFAEIRKRREPEPLIPTAETITQGFATGGLINMKDPIDLKNGERVIPHPKPKLVIPPKDEPIVQAVETVAETAPKPKPKRKPPAKKGAKK